VKHLCILALQMFRAQLYFLDKNIFGPKVENVVLSSTLAENKKVYIVQYLAKGKRRKMSGPIQYYSTRAALNSDHPDDGSTRLKRVQPIGPFGRAVFFSCASVHAVAKLPGYLTFW